MEQPQSHIPTDPGPGPSQEERLLAIGACATAHMCFGIIPFLIYLAKGKESRFVAYYSMMGAMAGATVICSLILFILTQAGGAAFGMAGVLNGGALGAGAGLISMVFGLFGCLSWVLLFLAVPGLIAAMIMSGIGAWSGRYAEIPVYSGWVRRFVKVP